MTWIIRNVHLRDGRGPIDVALDGDRIAEVAPGLRDAGADEIDGAGSLLVPGLVNAHQHLDKCLLGAVMRPNRSQTLQEAIEITWDHKRNYTVEEILQRADEVVGASIEHGTTAIRAFADVDTIGGLVPVQALLELRRRWQDLLTIQVVAFPQEGILRDPGCADLLAQAMELGADVVGGLPWYERTDRDVREHLEICFELARRHDADVHVLADDTDDPTSRSLEELAVQTLANGWQGRVTASHCGALAAYDHTHAQRVIGLVAAAGISIASNTQISLVLDGRNDRGLIRRGTTRIRELLDAGVNVLSAQDDVHDPYYPFGVPDQLEVAQYTAHVAQLTYPSELETVLDMVGPNAARAMRLDGYGLEVGDRADLVVLGADSVHDALRRRPPRRAVFSGGRLLTTSNLQVERHW